MELDWTKWRAFVHTIIMQRNDHLSDLGSFRHRDTSTIRGWKHAIFRGFLIERVNLSMIRRSHTVDTKPRGAYYRIETQGLVNP